MQSNFLRGLTRPGSSPFKNPAPHASPGFVNQVRVQSIKPDGTVRDDSGWIENIMCTFGLASLASMVGSGAGVNASTLVSAMRIGTQTTAATSTDTALGASTAVVYITDASLTKTNSAARTVQYQATFASNNPAGTAQINEVGMYCNSTAESQMAAHTILGTASVNKLASDTLQISYNVVFTTG
jgi:hypothetical protein